MVLIDLQRSISVSDGDKFCGFADNVRNIGNLGASLGC